MWFYEGKNMYNSWKFELEKVKCEILYAIYTGLDTDYYFFLQFIIPYWKIWNTSVLLTYM